jgi:LAO/AO transport system kinase|tara:strand:- start:175 stop:666 length:492 start_codon:yes stop_codon:yes gene_type:complete
MIGCLAACGWNRIVIETVGSGQSEIRIVAFADRVLLVDGPDRGDTVQAEKAGIMELADIIAINKSDLPNSQQAADFVRSAIGLSQDSQTPVHLVSAHDGNGVDELLEEIESCSGSQRRGRLRVRERLLSAWDSRLLGHPRINEVLDAVETGSITLDEAVEILD